MVVKKKAGAGAGTGQGDLKQLHGAMLALRFTTVQIERLAARAIWNAKPKDRTQAIICIMTALAKCQTKIGTCGGGSKSDDDKGDKGDKGPGDGGGGQGPDCPPGFKEEFGICVPDLPDEGFDNN